MLRKQYYNLMEQYCELISQKGFNSDFSGRKKLDKIKEKLVKFLLLQSCFLSSNEESFNKNEVLLEKVLIEDYLELADYVGTYQVKSQIKAVFFLAIIFLLLAIFTVIISSLLIIAL